MNYRQAIEQFIFANAKPFDKYEHQPRLYRLSRYIASQECLSFDTDILHAAVWLHDIGVFEGHRPTDAKELAEWDNVQYACQTVPSLLTQWHFPSEKIPAVVECIECHLPAASPTRIEAKILRDADMLEMMGAVSLMRQISKIGRDTRYHQHTDILPVLKQSFELENDLLFDTSRRIAKGKLAMVKSFLTSYEAESFYLDDC